VFYDSEDTHARVLGGGTINSRIGVSDAVMPSSAHSHAVLSPDGLTGSGTVAV